jgi:hypothetical protein
MPIARFHSLVSGIFRPELLSEMHFRLKQISKQLWSANPMMWNSFDAIWGQLEAMRFEITPQVDVGRVMNYIQQITKV